MSDPSVRAVSSRGSRQLAVRRFGHGRGRRVEGFCNGLKVPVVVPHGSSQFEMGQKSCRVPDSFTIADGMKD